MSDFKTIDNIFGTRSWSDVRLSVLRSTARRWPGVSRFDLEDAVGDAMLDLVDYWVRLGSSVSDDHERNFAYAVTRGQWKAKASLARTVSSYEGTMSLDSLDESLDEPDFLNELAVTPFADSPMPARSRNLTPSAEDSLIEHLEAMEVDEVITKLDEGEFDSWFNDFWTGDTITDIAERRGENPDAVRKRRDRGLARIARSNAA